MIWDLRFALRTLGRQKAFAVTVVTVLSLALGIATAIFSVVSGVLLKPLPFGRPDRLVQIREMTALTPQGEAVLLPSLAMYRRHSQAIAASAGYEVSGRFVRTAAGSERATGVQADRTLFDVLDVRPIAGRTFHADDPQDVAVLSEAFATRQFGSAPAAVGRRLALDTSEYTVIGVMPDRFQFPYGAGAGMAGVANQAHTDAWYPSSWSSGPAAARGRVSVVARLNDGVTVSAASAELAAMVAQVVSEVPHARGRTPRVDSLASRVVSVPVQRSLYILFWAVVLVWVIACANVMHLALAQMARRTREVAVRTALGAGQGRLIRQFLTESALLSIAGGAGGLFIAAAGLAYFRSALEARLVRMSDVSFDWRVFLFFGTGCAFAAALAGLAPLLIARVQAQAVLKESTGASAGGRSHRLRQGLILVEVAIASVLSVGGALLVREVLRLRATDPGLTPSNVMTVHLGHRMTPASDPRQFYEIADRLAHLPGVQDRKSTRLNSSHVSESRMPSSA